MAIQLGETLRNNMINQYETTVGTAPKLQIRSGTRPAAPATAPADGALLDTITLPSDWMAIVGSQTGNDAGKIAKNGTWVGGGAAAAAGAGTNATYYRLMNSAESVCHETGTVTATGGGGDLTLDNISIATAQIITVTGWNRTQGGG